MSVFFASLFLILSGTLGARQPNIDHNSQREVKQTSTGFFGNSGNYIHGLSSSITNRKHRSNDYDDYSSGVIGPRTPMQFLYPSPSYTDEETPIKVYQPREDPRLFYQSDAYIKEIMGKNVNNEVTNIYPGKEVVRFGEVVPPAKSIPARRSREDNRIDFSEFKLCIKCPRDRTVIAKVGSNRVVLQSPRLLSCSGRKVPKNVRFMHYFGPKFGSLLEEGTYSIIGRIVNWNENLQICKYKVHAVVQTCHTPKYLVAHCKGQYRTCKFSCRDRKMELMGPSSLQCGEDLQWEANLPTCRVRNWCKQPLPPDHGRISCSGNPVVESDGALAEGSRCRVRCANGWHSYPRITFCHRGNWTRAVACQPNKNTDAG